MVYVAEHFFRAGFPFRVDPKLSTANDELTLRVFDRLVLGGGVDRVGPFVFVPTRIKKIHTPATGAQRPAFNGSAAATYRATFVPERSNELPAASAITPKTRCVLELSNFPGH